MMEINKGSLTRALESMLGEPVSDATYVTETLQGGTVGDVSRLDGDAATEGGVRPFTMVVKTQKKWDRHGDPDCWRREHDIYKANMTDGLPGQIRLPRCYLLEEEDGVTRIWMEHIRGATGSARLHAEELALAAERLGEFQAEFHLRGRKDLPWLRGYPAVRSSFDLWHNHILAGRLGESIEGFPEALRQILNGYAARAGAVLDSFDALPLTLCQGDVHHDNLILREEADGVAVYLIDWDCAGYGRMGEDAVDVLMEAFVYSDRDVSLLPEYRRRIVGSYCAGARRQGVDFAMGDAHVRDIFALAWGFRIACWWLHSENEEHKRRSVEILYTMLL